METWKDNAGRRLNRTKEKGGKILSVRGRQDSWYYIIHMLILCNIMSEETLKSWILLIYSMQIAPETSNQPLQQP